jgi:hypothetical protein
MLVFNLNLLEILTFSYVTVVIGIASSLDEIKIDPHIFYLMN